MKKKSLKIMKCLALALALVLGCSGTLYARSAPSTGSLPTSSNPLGEAVSGTGMNFRWPVFLGGSFGLGSGAGVGDGYDIGLCEIKPMLGVWLPGFVFLRLGYGYSSYEEKNNDDEINEVESSNFSVDLGVHILSEFYVMSSYSRVNALSEKGDVAWNEWSLGIGTFWMVFSRTFLIFDVGYHWVREHYDPFIDRRVSGGRLQMNFGFIVFVY